MDTARRKSAVAALSVASNTSLIILKVIVGVATGSVSVLSEAIHSGVDLVAALIALIAVRGASKPPDVRHPFGHGKFENLSGTIEAVLIFLAAGWIVYEAVSKLVHPEPLHAVGWGALVMFISAALNLAVSSLLFRVARQTGSVALEADGWHLRTDVYTSAGVMIALSTISAGSILWPGVNLGWIDSVAAIFVALLIVRAAWELTIKAGRDLLDERLPPQEEDRIVAIVRADPSVRGLHRLRTRRAGNERFVEFHVFVDATMVVQDSHALSHRLADQIRAALGGAAHVVIHVEPA